MYLSKSTRMMTTLFHRKSLNTIHFRAEKDGGLTPALAGVVDGILGDGHYKPGYNRTSFLGVGHGFAVRANLVRTFYLTIDQCS